MTANSLDDSVYAASKELRGRGAPDPDVLFFLGTGVGLLPAALRASWRLPLEGVAGVPRTWRGGTLLAAESSGATFWFLEDAPGEHLTRHGGDRRDEAWVRAFPTWLAACSGATICLHTSAGSLLPDAEREGPEECLAIVKDHINFSGQTPLFGLGESRLGALFPDQTHLHHPGLRAAAHRHAARLGLPVIEAVAACTAGPALETHAEREYHARAGAGVTVQDLADPLIAMAHAGLSCLSIVAVLKVAREIDVAELVTGAERLAPALEELLEALVPDLANHALVLREEP